MTHPGRSNPSLARAPAVVFAVWLGASWVPACSGTNGSGGYPLESQTGQACASAAQCFSALDAAALHGTATCLTQLQNGYCTHTCQSDSDCCAVPGECRTGFKEICAPFESTAQHYCFLSCVPAAIAAVPDSATTDPTTYCQTWANASFTCRSTGGGSQNQKFCGP